MPAKKTIKTKKIMVEDVQKPEDIQKSTGSTPAIVGNKPLVEDPMIAKKSDEVKVVKKERKILTPENAKNDGEQEVSEIAPKKESELIEKDLKTSETVVEPEKPKKPEEPNDEQSTEMPAEEDRSDEDIGGWSEKIDEIADEKKVDENDTSNETQGDSSGETWQEFAPADIHDAPVEYEKKDHVNVGHKITWIVTGLITSTIVILVVLNLLIDLEIIEIGIKPITNLF